MRVLLFLTAIFFSAVRARVCACARWGVHEHWRAVPAHGLLHAPTPRNTTAPRLPRPAPCPALVILTDTDVRISTKRRRVVRR